MDPDLIFKSGFLADVYNENSTAKVQTRFPPEPNGYLHIGHAKAIAVNFGFARFHGGECFLRMDDTNPKGEEERYIRSIEELVRWMGFKPLRVTYSSDYFDRLYELAETLILKDGAYVCHCTESEIKAQRGLDDTAGKKGAERYACPHRGSPTSDSLAEFRAMQAGKYRAGQAALRMKQDLSSPNPQMWDIFAYRVVEDENGEFCSHLRTGGKWKVYPTYDFAHCLCDSVEGITHSLCTTEFEMSRESYEWLCERVGVYKPMQKEYGRLNVSGTILSKRKLIKLVEGEDAEKSNRRKYVRGWDDPRLFTLVGLRRRGISPGAILSFVSELGVTKAKTSIEISRFENAVRAYLEPVVPRLMLVVDPVAVIIENLPDEYVEMVEVPYSKDPSMGTHVVPFTKKVYIERGDFREEGSKGFFRLCPGGSVGLLKVPYPITATSFETDPESGAVTVVRARYDRPEEGGSFKKPKAYIHWVGDSPGHQSPVRAEVRAFNRLFQSSNPASHPDGFLADLNPQSEEVWSGAVVDIGIDEVRRRAPFPSSSSSSSSSGDGGGGEGVRFQGMRVGYFCEDGDSRGDKVVLNRIVTLKEDAGK